jgi:hypothetical protein
VKLRSARSTHQQYEGKMLVLLLKVLIEQRILLINSKLQQAFYVLFVISVAIYTVLAVPLPQRQGLKLDLSFAGSCLIS